MVFPDTTLTFTVLPRLGGGIPVTINPADFPEASLRHIWEYGWRQFAADAAAGCKNKTAATALIDKKLAKLRDGPPVGGGGGDGLSAYRDAAVTDIVRKAVASGKITKAVAKTVLAEKGVSKRSAALLNALGITDEAGIDRVMKAIDDRAAAAHKAAKEAAASIELDFV